MKDFLTSNWISPRVQAKNYRRNYFVPRANGYEAIEAIYALRDKITPLIQISEVRSIAADNIIMSPMYQQDTIAIHLRGRKIGMA
ncbi:MAG: hypothetical protein WDO14_18000 [Bacteroidota bacterium]